MRRKKLKVGIVGVGGIANGAHIPAWKKLQEEGLVELKAFCDIKEERAKKAAEEFSAKYFTDYKDMLNEKLDIIDICTPNYYHSIIAVDALNAGKNVLCEKPDAISVEEVQKMYDASKKNKKLLMAIRNNRFRKISKYVKDIVDSGELGEVYVARCGYIRRRGIPWWGEWFTDKKLAGGGPLIDLGVHILDLTMWVTGFPEPKSISASTYLKIGKNSQVSDFGWTDFESIKEKKFDVEDLAIGFMRFKNSMSLQFEFSWASNIEKENFFLELLGTKAGLSYHMNSDGIFIKIYGESHGHSYDLTPRVKEEKWANGHENQIRHFVNCVLGKEEPQVTPYHGITMIKILTSAYKSAELGKEIEF
ncbi:MAG: hypothetical protein PWQ20_349 [Thermotogaceae bacterium]|jgi:predicted dehydrogenase|nr:hypothetical protein [Thermotogaceae bacterium]MDN5337279.1 hypothetical protein [Thermotogaceae bacterium]